MGIEMGMTLNDAGQKANTDFFFGFGGIESFPIPV